MRAMCTMLRNGLRSQKRDVSESLREQDDVRRYEVWCLDGTRAPLKAWLPKTIFLSHKPKPHGPRPSVPHAGTAVCRSAHTGLAVASRPCSRPSHRSTHTQLHDPATHNSHTHGEHGGDVGGGAWTWTWTVSASCRLHPPDTSYTE